MEALRRLLCWLAPLVVLAAALRDGADVRAADELYPPTRQDEAIRFLFVDTDEPNVGAMNAALRELDARIVYGPRTTSARPGRAFFAVRAPFDVAATKLEGAARKSGGAARELVCIAFEGRDDRDGRVTVAGFNFTSRDFVMGMSGEIVWFDSAGGWSQFYGLPKKLDAEEIADRYAKLYAPYGGGKLGRVVRERFTWTLARAPDAKRQDKLLKAIRKLDGVASATIDGVSLAVEVVLDRVRLSGIAGNVPAGSDAKEELDSAGLGAPRASFSTRPLWDLLEAEGLAPEAQPKK